METDKESTNSRPATNSSIPALTLVVLVGIIIALLYVGYDYISDDTNGSDELTNVALDTTTQQALVQEDPEMLMAPQEADTSSQPAPVDLSQAEPPADVPVADATAEDVAVANREVTAKPAAEKPGVGTPKEEKKEPVAKTEKKVEKPGIGAPKEEQKEERPVERIAVKPGGVTRPYTIGAGETFYGVANRYNMKLSTLKALNPNVAESDIKAGVTRLNVKAMAVHTVGAGDVLRVVAQKYGVSKEAIMRANKKSKDIATRGEKLIIPYPDKQ